ncbi:hypothetical protein BDV59DRAFT_200779 [Aspergillus ambiguus]|uniref:non-ribosomal peptide synthetase n=1 Tax=Aspergillus ambiguus TaxID=176160 RepID=UPI003CCE2B0B
MNQNTGTGKRRDTTQKAIYEKQLAYWTEQLHGSQPAELLYDNPRPPVKSESFGSLDVNISGPLCADLHIFCQAYSVPPSVVLLTAFRIAHYRLTRSSDALIGTVMERRGEYDPFNIQCIRIHLEGEESFENLLRTVQGTVEAAQENQDITFQQILSTLSHSQDLRHRPLVNIGFAFQAQASVAHSDSKTSPTNPTVRPTTNSRLDVELQISQTDGNFNGKVAYALDILRPETIYALRSAFYGVLRHGLAVPSVTPDSVSLKANLDILDQMGLLHMNRIDYPRESSIIEVFQQQASKCPSRMAVKDMDTQMTYEQLDQKSDHLARWLARQAFGKEGLVGVYAGRSCETIVAFFGILKAGLAFVPLDVKAPMSRIHTIIDSLPTCKLILLGSDIEPFVGGAVGAHGVRQIPIAEAMDTTAETIRSLPSATNLAYIIFTSGSTGKPKGVMIEHRGVVRLAKNSGMLSFPLEGHAVAHMANLAFDMSTWEIFTALLNGGSLICIDNRQILDYIQLSAIFQQEKIRLAMITPGLLKCYLEYAPQIIRQLSSLYVGGDKVDAKEIRQSQELVSTSVYNIYGPTENTSISTFYQFPRSETCVNGVPIGRSIANSGAYVVDQQLRLVPPGVMGELVVTGDGLARGYTDPRLNEGRFFQLKLTEESTVRAYRTGDLARYRPTDGQLDFLGRIDHQVKIRGHRVEPGEIENTLIAEQFISDAVILVQKRDSVDVDLIAFVTVHQKSTADKMDGTTIEFDTQQIEKHLRESLRTKLPSYMQPKSIKCLREMPLNNNGKVDRQALARQLDEVPVSAPVHDTRAPISNDSERAISKEFTKILGFDIGVAEDFFESGGHSLAAIKAIYRINKRLHTNLTAGDLFDCPTISSLAQRIESSRRTSTDTGSFCQEPATVKPFSLCPLDHPLLTQGPDSSEGVVDILPTTSTQAWFITHWGRVSFAFSLKGNVDIDKLRMACLAVVKKHSSLRTIFTKHKEHFFQVICQTASEPFIHYSAGDVQATAHQLCHEDARKPIPLGKQLAQFTLISQSPTEHSFVIQLCHTQYDGNSLHYLLSDLAQAYRLNHDSLSDATPFSSYIYARARKQSADAFNFWKQYLQGASLSKMTPTPSADSVCCTDIQEKAVSSLPALLPGITLSTLVNAAFVFIATRMLNTQDITFGLLMNTRDILTEGAETMLGPCLNRNVVRAQLQPDWTVQQLCQHLHDSYAKISHHSHLELPEIMSHCTNWSPNSDFGFLMNHVPGNLNPSLSLEGVESSFFSMGLRIDLSEQVLLGPIVTGDQLEFHVLTSSKMMDSQSAQLLASKISQTVSLFSRSPHTTLQSLYFLQ